jgi:hypothetical protein
MEPDRKYNFGMGLLVGVLALFAGIILYLFVPGSPWFIGGNSHVISHYVGTSLLIVFGLIGLAFYRRIGRVGISVSVLSVIMGIVYILEIPGLLFNYMQPHAMAMGVVAGLQILWGLIGIGGAILVRRQTTQVTRA